MQDAVKASPAVGVAGLKLLGVLLADWVVILTVIYTLFLIIDKADAVFSKLIRWGRKLWRCYGDKEG